MFASILVCSSNAARDTKIPYTNGGLSILSFVDVFTITKWWKSEENHSDKY